MRIEVELRKLQNERPELGTLVPPVPGALPAVGAAAAIGAANGDDGIPLLPVTDSANGSSGTLSSGPGSFSKLRSMLNVA